MDYGLRELRRIRKIKTLTIYDKTGDVEIQHVTSIKRTKLLKSNDKRGEIEVISEKSIKRLMQTIRKIDTSVGKWSMLTLTYLQQPESGLTASRHLAAFRRVLERTYGTDVVAGIWWKEFQARGVLHFHLFLAFHPSEEPQCDKSGNAYFKKATAALSARWAYCTGEGDTAASRCSARWEPIRAANGISRYAAKYLSKKEQKVAPKGFCVSRAWGVWNDAALQKLACEKSEGVDSQSVMGVLKASLEHGVFYSFQMGGGLALGALLSSDALSDLPAVAPARERILTTLRSRVRQISVALRD